MSEEYDKYLKQHRENVRKGFDWLCENLPEVIENEYGIRWQTEFDHDQSKYNADEYEAYDAYFYGNNPSYEVVQNYKRAWLLHIHRNLHHWQHWILINDDPNEGEIVLEMPYNYIIEMICDWWSFSWSQDKLDEIFNWYSEHSEYMKLESNTRKIVENILEKIYNKLTEKELIHSGVKGMKWGVKNGPPYPIKEHGNSARNVQSKNIINVDHVKLTGEPNSITQIKRKNGGVDRNYYDSSGKQSKQISNHDHGQPKRHPYGEHGEHAHDYIYDKDGNLCGRPVRELTDIERKENNDIL